MAIESRSRWIIALIVAFACGIALAFMASRFVRSPHEEAIQNSKVVPTVTAEIQERTFVAKQANVKGRASTGSSFDLRIPAGDIPSVVTAVGVSQGATVSPGSVLGRVSGRPVIALSLPFTLYRDIQPGDSGDDVVALQRALAALGAYRGGVDGVYGPSTQAAVKKLYRDRQLTPPTDSQLAPETGASTAANGEGATKTGDDAAPAAPPKAGTPLKRQEIFALQGNSAVVESIAPVGTVLNDDTPFAKLRSGATTVTARVPSSLKDAFAQNASVNVENGGETITGQVQSVSEFRGAGDQDYNNIPGFDVTIAVPSTASLTEGAILTVSSTNSAAEKKGLAVPVTAIREDSGHSYVTLSNSGKSRVEVSVETTSDGWALVSGDGLEAGARVVITGQQ